MGYPTKIATCCYCGARAALVLDKTRHELACSGCGAPLHDLKSLPVRRERAGKVPRDVRGPELRKYRPKKAPKHIKPKKRKKARFWDLAEDLFDFVEDIFD